MPPEPGGERHLTTFGAYGSGAGQFVWPAGIALDGDGNVYVTDEWSNRVSVYDPDGEPLRTWGSRRETGRGSSTGRPASPSTPATTSTSSIASTTACSGSRRTAAT